ncbi:MAG: hypothetical protein ACKOC1_01210 [Hyphomicrobiales bacterium]
MIQPFQGLPPPFRPTRWRACFPIWKRCGHYSIRTATSHSRGGDRNDRGGRRVDTLTLTWVVAGSLILELLVLIVFLVRVAWWLSQRFTLIDATLAASAFHVLGGNQSDRVTISRLSRNRLVAVRRPAYRAQPANVRPIALAASGSLSVNEA